MELHLAEYKFGRAQQIVTYSLPKYRVPGCGSQQYVGEAILSKTLHTSPPPPPDARPDTKLDHTADLAPLHQTPKTTGEDSRPRSGALGGVSMASDRAIKARI